MRSYFIYLILKSVQEANFSHLNTYKISVHPFTFDVVNRTNNSRTRKPEILTLS